MLGFLLGLFNAGAHVANDTMNNIENSYRGEIAAKAKEPTYWDSNGKLRHTKTRKLCYELNNVIRDAKTGRALETIPPKPNAVICKDQLRNAIQFATLVYPCKVYGGYRKKSINEMTTESYKSRYYNLEYVENNKVTYENRADYCRDVLTGREGVVRQCSAFKLDGRKTIFRIEMTFLLDKYNGHIIRCFQNAYGDSIYDIHPDPSSDVYINGYRITFDVDGFNNFQDEYYKENGFYFTQHYMESRDRIKEYDPLDPEKIEMILIKAAEEDHKHSFKDWMKVEYVGESPKINLNAGSKKKILICDNYDGHMAINGGIINLGYEYESIENAYNEEEAVEKCAKAMPDIAYVRLNMIDCDGIRCIKRLRRIKSDIKIILICSLTNNDDLYWLEKLWEEQIEVQDIIPWGASESRMKLCLEKQAREECGLPKEHWLAPDYYEKLDRKRKW